MHIDFCTDYWTLKWHSCAILFRILEVSRLGIPINTIIITQYTVCEVQAEGVQYRLKGTKQRVPSACTTHPQPIMYTLNLHYKYIIQGDHE